MIFFFGKGKEKNFENSTKWGGDKKRAKKEEKTPEVFQLKVGFYFYDAFNRKLILLMTLTQVERVSRAAAAGGA